LMISTLVHLHCPCGLISPDVTLQHKWMVKRRAGRRGSGATAQEYIYFVQIIENDSGRASITVE
jgi:hypothetical protein